MSNMIGWIKYFAFGSARKVCKFQYYFRILNCKTLLFLTKMAIILISNVNSA